LEPPQKNRNSEVDDSDFVTSTKKLKNNEVDDSDLGTSTKIETMKSTILIQGPPQKLK
jgi:hypothetical protein